MRMLSLGIVLLTASTSLAVPREYWTALVTSDGGGQVQFYGTLGVHGIVRRGRLACLGSCLRPRARIRIGIIGSTFAFRAKLGKTILCTGNGTFAGTQGTGRYVCTQGFVTRDAGNLLVYR